MKLLEAVDHCLTQAGKEYGDAIAPMVLLYAAASQTIHLAPNDAAATFELARKEIVNSGAIGGDSQ